MQIYCQELTVVRRILLASHQSLGMEQGAVGTGLDLVNDIGFQVNVQGTRDVFASSSFYYIIASVKIFITNSVRRTCGKGSRGDGKMEDRHTREEGRETRISLGGRIGRKTAVRLKDGTT